MRTIKTILQTLPILAALFIATGCGKSPGSPDAVKPARQTSFDEVTSQLDPGGSVYGYLSTDQWLAGLSTNVAGLREVLAEIPGVEADDREKLDTAFNIATSLIRSSGLEDVTGVGLSGVQVSDELHRTKLIVHHKKGRGEGFMWNIAGKQAHALEGLNLLSTNVAMASFGDFDVKLLWQVIEKEMGSSGVPELSEGVRKWPAMFEAQTKISWDKLLASLGGEAGIVLTMNDSKKIKLPIPGQAMEISEPGLMLVIKVNDDLIYDRIAAELKKTQMAEFTEEKGVKMAVMAFPLPVPIDLDITVASSGGYLFIASSSSLVRDALAVRDGSQPGLRKTAEFAALMKHLPSEGNQFFYIDRRFSETITQVQKQSLQSASQADRGASKFMEKYFFNRPPAYGLSVSGHTPTGWKGVTIGNQDSSTAVLVAPAAAVVGIGAAMALPAMSNAKEKAQSINCINNMKQQGLAFRLWAGDNGDKYPFNVSKSKGGTLELCDHDSDGYDRNSARHFLVMKNELGTPKILLCPSDKKTAAASFETLEPENVSYKIRSGSNVDESHPEEVLIYCPIHGHKAFADGSVRAGKGK